MGRFVKKQVARGRNAARRNGRKAAVPSGEDLYREIVEDADDLIVRLDESGRLVYVNRASDKILGISPDELVGRLAGDFIHPDDLLITDEILSRMKRDGVSCINFENRWIDRAGGVHNISWTAHRHEDGSGKIAGVNAIGKDITRLRQAEAALCRCEKGLRAIVLRNVDGMIVLDYDGSVQYVNPAAAALFGMRAADMLGMNFGFPIVPDEPVEAYILREPESFVAVEMRLFEIEWAGKPSYLISFRDLTDRIIAERTMRQVRYELETEIEKRVLELSRLNESLRESEEKFRTLTKTVAMAILVYQGERFVHANPAAERITGYSREELLSMKFWDIAHPDDRRMIKEREMARQQGKPVPTRYEARYLAKDGREGVLEINASTINFYGRQAGLITALDVTDRKRVEMALKEAKAHAELYLDLMGHDINNMHQIALGYLEIAEEIEDNEYMKELLARPRDVLLRSARLIDNVRKLQKLKEGIYESRPVELIKVLSDVLREYKTMHGKYLTLNTHTIRCGYVYANELLYDVFSNLVSNAIKHSGAYAEVIISLKRAKVNGNDYYQVSVEDNGPGIPDNFKDKVFNRMLRGDASAKGMGLGLYIVKTLVDSYCGQVWVEDRVPGDHSKGAKFVVLLPALNDV